MSLYARIQKKKTYSELMHEVLMPGTHTKPAEIIQVHYNDEKRKYFGNFVD